MSRRMMIGLIWAGLVMAIPAMAADEAGEKVYPANQEPFHHLKFENDQVEVLVVKLAPHQGTYYHRHSHDQMGISLTDIDAYNQKLGAAEVHGLSRAGTITYVPHSLTGGYVHRLKVGDIPAVIVDFEFKKPAGAGATMLMIGPDQAEGRFPQGTVRRLTIAPGESQSLAGSIIVPTAPGALKVGKGPAWRFELGAFRWIGDKGATNYINNSGKPVSLILVSLDK